MAQPKTTATKTPKQNHKLKTLKTASGTYTQVNLLNPHTVLMACSSVNHYRSRGQARPTGNHIVSSQFLGRDDGHSWLGKEMWSGYSSIKQCLPYREAHLKNYTATIGCMCHALYTSSTQILPMTTGGGHRQVRTQSGCLERVRNCLVVQGW